MSKIALPRLVPVLVAAAVASGGCATVFKGKTTNVAVTSDTPGANVAVDGRSVGVTPMTVELSNKASAVITVKQGGREESCKMDSSASVGWIVADVFLTSGVGILIDWATHSWNNVAPQSCHAPV